MAFLLSARMLCQCAESRKFLFARERGTQEPYRIISLQGNDPDQLCDALRAKSESSLDLRLCRQELLPSEPVNGVQGPAIVFCRLSFFLDGRTVARIKVRAPLEIDFFSVDELPQKLEEGLVTQDDVETFSHLGLL